MAIGELTFLVAEDHDFQRKTLVRMLQGLGAKTVLEAADGKLALEAFRDLTQPDRYHHLRPRHARNGRHGVHPPRWRSRCADLPDPFQCA